MLKIINSLVIGIMFFTFFFGCESASKITVQLEETSEAFKNPLIGFRPTWRFEEEISTEHEYAAVYKHYIKYTDLEEKPDDSFQKIINWCNKAWAGIEDKNIKVMPRVVIVYPNGPDGGSSGYWPEGLSHDDPYKQWVSEEFERRITSFIQKLSQAWDNDPRVAGVEMGLWGKWGEHHMHPVELPITGDRIPPKMQKVLGDAFLKAFTNKKIMVRYPETFTDYNFGYYWDSFALPNDTTSVIQLPKSETWKTQMISGEVAYNWGDQSKLGGNPNGTLISDFNTDYVIDWIYKTHNSSLGWIADYDAENETIKKNAARMQKTFGYRFVIREATFDTNLEQTLNINLTVENIGVAPMYYNWPVELSILNLDKEVVWKDNFGVDIAKWLPNTKFQLEGEFDVSELTDGTYILAVAVLDPAGNVPSLRFANTNYYKGGRTPLGKIGINQKPADQTLSPFDKLKEDDTLYYVVEN